MLPRRKAGRKTAAPPLPVQAQPGWPRIKEPGPGSASLCSDPIYTRPAGCLAPPTSGLGCPLFIPSQGWGTWTLVLSVAVAMRWKSCLLGLSSLLPPRCELAAQFDPVPSRLGGGGIGAGLQPNKTLPREERHRNRDLPHLP
jgi:hypothetical protein